MEEQTTNRNAFAFYRSFMDAIERIPDEILKAKAYKVIVEYGLNGIEPTLNEEYVITIIFTQAKPQIDANIIRYNNCVKNGKKGGAPKGNTNAKTTKKQPKNNQEDNQRNNQKTTLKDKDKDKDKVKDKVKDKERDKSLYTQNKVLQDISLNYPNITMDFENCNFDISNFDFEKLNNAIKDSEYLQNATLSFMLTNYDKVISNSYKSFVIKETPRSKNFEARTYTKEQTDSLFTNLEDIDI